jgi:NAD(P)-dependent dehydrogenase (short-subunit alcohol dehydrogenase family)
MTKQFWNIFLFSYSWQDLAASVNSEAGELYPVKCDVSKEAELKSAFDWVEETLGGVDILINNAAIDPRSNLIGKKQHMSRCIISCHIGKHRGYILV